MVKQAVCYSFSLNADEPMAYLRLTAPLREAGIHLINGFEKQQTNIEAVYKADVVIFQREFPTRVDDYQKISALARQEGKPVLFELDDLLFSLPEIHPDRHRGYYAPTLLPMFQALIEADVVTVPTPKLREVLLAFNPNVVVLPNCFDEQIWQMTPPVQKEAGEPLTIGYMGTNSHKPDLAYTTPVLVEMLERYSPNLKFIFWGVQPPAELAAHPQVQWVSRFFSSYREFAEFFQTQSADIFIAPLLDHLFNRCKSSIKFFEYSALGVPGVFSQLEPYTDVVTHGQNGFLASSLDEWRDCLSQLIENSELRYQVATNAQASIQEKWRLSANAFQWPGAFDQAIANYAPHAPQKNEQNNLIQSINMQLFESFNQKAALERLLKTQVAEREQAIQTLKTQLDQTRNEVEELKTEVLTYALSKSWRLTRPFRAINRKCHILLRRGDG